MKYNITCNYASMSEFLQAFKDGETYDYNDIYINGVYLGMCSDLDNNTISRDNVRLIYDLYKKGHNINANNSFVERDEVIIFNNSWIHEIYTPDFERAIYLTK